MPVYDATSYKTYLRTSLAQKKQAVSASRYTYERLAKACGIQKTYLSRVLNSDASHLSDDQLYLACRFLGLGAEERDFLLLLRDWERSQIADRKAELAARIASVRERHQRTEAYLEAKAAPDPAALAAYYLDPDALLAHVALAVPRFRDDPRRLASLLGVGEERLAAILATLESLGLVELTPRGYVLRQERTHLPSDSVLFPPYRTLQRLRALERIGKLAPGQGYNFSVVFAATEAVRQTIRGKFLALLSEVEALVAAAPSEEVYQMSFDLFDWSR